MKHTAFKIPQNTKPISPTVTDKDWENYIQKRLDEESDFYNSTSHLTEKPRGY